MRKFTRTIEDFECENCKTIVQGNGYTNHCPSCLYSKHVDINPGDRLAECGGLMKPIEVELKKGEYILIHKCESCGHIKKNRLSEKDNFETLIKIASSIIP